MLPDSHPTNPSPTSPLPAAAAAASTLESTRDGGKSERRRPQTCRGPEEGSRSWRPKHILRIRLPVEQIRHQQPSIWPASRSLWCARGELQQVSSSLDSTCSYLTFFFPCLLPPNPVRPSSPPDLAWWWRLLPLPWRGLRGVCLLGKRHPSSTPCAPYPFIHPSLFTSIPIQASQMWKTILIRFHCLLRSWL